MYCSDEDPGTMVDSYCSDLDPGTLVDSYCSDVDPGTSRGACTAEMQILVHGLRIYVT